MNIDKIDLKTRSNIRAEWGLLRWQDGQLIWSQTFLNGTTLNTWSKIESMKGRSKHHHNLGDFSPSLPTINRINSENNQ